VPERMPGSRWRVHSKVIGPAPLSTVVRREQHTNMKILRFFVASAVFVLVWVAVAVLLALATRTMFPGVTGNIPVLGVHWANLPGSALGVVAGYRVFHVLGGSPEKEPKK